MRPLLTFVAAAGLLLPGSFGTFAADLPTELVTEEFMVDSAVSGIQLYVRNKHPANMTQVPTGRVLLYVHGATLPSEATFDLPLDGLSWMDYIARHGWDVYLTDVRGYGRSTRPREFAQAGATRAPITWTDAKVQDVGTVVDFILRRREVTRISLLGWSWGTVVMAAFAADHSSKVDSLVLFAPVWCRASCAFDRQSRDTLAGAHANDSTMAAFVAPSMAAVRRRLQQGAPSDRLDELLPPAWFEAWSAATLASDPIGASQNPPVLRVPAGVSQDAADYWNSGKSYYDPKSITVPTLVVVAEWDEETPPSGARALYDQLTNSQPRRFLELQEGTHMILLEKNRMELFDAVQTFLDEVNRLP